MRIARYVVSSLPQKDKKGLTTEATGGIFLRSFGETLSSMLAKLESLPQSTKDHDVRLVSNHRAHSGRFGPDSPQELYSCTIEVR